MLKFIIQLVIEKLVSCCGKILVIQIQQAVSFIKCCSAFCTLISICFFFLSKKTANSLIDAVMLLPGETDDPTNLKAIVKIKKIRYI